MGNCMVRRSGGADDGMVRVMTSGGGVMELRPPVTVECITNGFPGHGVFRGAKSRSSPLLHNEELLAGETYYLRPINDPVAGASSIVASYRVSFNQPGFSKKQESEAPPRCTGANLGSVASGGAHGVWKVKLVISPAQLADILSQDARTEALIESVRTVAKCGYGAAASGANSDQWSLASSRKASSDAMA